MILKTLLFRGFRSLNQLEGMSFLGSYRLTFSSSPNQEVALDFSVEAEDKLLQDIQNLHSDLSYMGSIVNDEGLHVGKGWKYNFHSSYWKDGASKVEHAKELSKKYSTILKEIDHTNKSLYPQYPVLKHPPMRPLREFRRRVDEFGQVSGVGRRKAARAMVEHTSPFPSPLIKMIHNEIYDEFITTPCIYYEYMCVICLYMVR